MEYVSLNDGNKIPAIGFGVFTIPNDGPTYEAVLQALKAAYRCRGRDDPECHRRRPV